MNKEKNAETLLAICFGLLVIALIFKISILIKIAVVIAGIGLFSPYLSSKITWIWLKLATVLGHINGSILLSVVFFVFLTPIAFIMRWVNKTSMLKSKPSSMFIEKNHTYSAKDLDKMW